ncbi:alpha-N-acetyl-neuraminyl-2,3-beta-galactosyl-1,3-N-acetyl-galactosaminide alpha-2,6-sialyltransferase isoform X3 [Anguilla anguilla]|uniref:alpha-N-acetyl-neuraminyl-2,3-beta-galactosyl-1, 3-N-acetyl-galactosaminide alpha-2,6-sialyltransferase isoform X3 n=1 Tax=Anguilla anguilla TaxID=7936 RepID=UPI0015AB2328|nr:alpha-N-acetyl-neuraminyl-2,3-beta-galactosyl-1,3-N-acetyl-galactosaminide alpha-2,6-sialyltransferase isoform X3 [Anguilla anguilla]XP_035247076.1 alpha-N-acetyl-neuraminyl-2,3-beta-galactosyl-1,3-N-acetyl-galactosaminide alpha-2,6-sialyltransferase isoform X3 [Anguilla anguilla]XP_035247078.1 alpha-N-acetyl-neuraminyl-2,3-beta-galactosyl-1,3-N-acetyl-galactosaminide alpha-2,6-sialyltransferase isoform X3 [Anguilla anguilla]
MHCCHAFYVCFLELIKIMHMNRDLLAYFSLRCIDAVFGIFTLSKTTGLVSSRHRVYWICLLIVSALSVVLWYNHVTKLNVTIMANVGLRGYVRITSGQMDQYLDVHCKECALVSSSGQMLKAGKGKEIDELDCVIRMNNAPTVGYEHDVGSKTSLRVVSHTSVPLILKNETYYFQQSAGTVYVVWGPERNMRQDGKGKIFNVLLKAAKKYSHAKIYVVTREKIQYCDGLFQNETGKNRMQSGAFLSTGFFTMVLAMDMCDSIQVYGMISDDYCSQANHTAVPYHYYERGRMDECRMYRVHEKARRGGHRFITEKAIYGRWASHKKMQFHHPSWTARENVS